jgi:hypothetical protein
MKTEETRIPVAGVLRCCLESVAIDHLGKEVNPGDVSHCKHCGEMFVLCEDGHWRPETIEKGATP